MLATYGVEAARKTIVDQVLMVFGAYGIQVREQQEIHSISTRRLLRIFFACCAWWMDCKDVNSPLCSF